jgi:hypothetical protein
MKTIASASLRARAQLVVIALLAAQVWACAAHVPAPTPTYEITPFPTVPLTTPTPAPTTAPLPTRPVGKETRPADGRPIGPVITFFGAGRADGLPAQPASTDRNGIPTYTTSVGSGFMLIVEAKPGESGFEVGRRVYAHVAGDPTVRPDLEIQATRDLGDGSKAVCDRRRPKIGGIPRINPPSFAERQPISDAINDLSCRFEVFSESDFSCTITPNEEFSFVKPETTTQFCLIIARAYGFPAGDTIVSVRVRDVEGYPGPVSKIRIRRMPPPKPKKN